MDALEPDYKYGGESKAGICF